MLNYRLKIDFCDDKVLVSDISFVSGDIKSTTLNFEFYNEGKRVDISGYTLSVRAKRSDGVVIASGGKIEENTAVFTPESNMYAVPGELYIEIALADSSGRYATTKVITAEVIEGLGEAATEGVDNLNIYVNLLKDAIYAKETAESAAEIAKSVHPEIVDGVWWVFDGEKGEMVSSGIKAKGVDGYTPRRGTDYWTGEDREKIKSEVASAIKPRIIGDMWHIYDSDAGTVVSTGVRAVAKDIIIDDVMSDTSENPVQNKVVKAYVDGNRTHYTETVLLCDYTHTIDSEIWDGSDYGGTFTFDKELDVDNLKLYINGEYVPTTYITEDNDLYLFNVDDIEYINTIFEYCKSQKYINFPPWLIKGNNYKVYEEAIHQIAPKYIPKLDESHLPYTTPQMINCESDLICQYTYDSTDYEGDYYPGIVVNKKLTKDNITVYVNDEKVNDLYVDDNGYTDGSFFVFCDSIIFYNYTDDTVVFYPGWDDGTVIQIYEENFNAIKDSNISNGIARTQYVDRLVNEKIGDIDAAIDGIIALQNEFIGGAIE